MFQGWWSEIGEDTVILRRANVEVEVFSHQKIFLYSRQQLNFLWQYIVYT